MQKHATIKGRSTIKSKKKGGTSPVRRWSTTSRSRMQMKVDNKHTTKGMTMPGNENNSSSQGTSSTKSVIKAASMNIAAVAPAVQTATNSSSLFRFMTSGGRRGLKSQKRGDTRKGPTLLIQGGTDRSTSLRIGKSSSSSIEDLAVVDVKPQQPGEEDHDADLEVETGTSTSRRTSRA